MPSSTISYWAQGRKRPIVLQSTTLPGRDWCKYRINARMVPQAHRGTRTAYELTYRDNDFEDPYLWSGVENIENPGSTSCAFLRDVNAAFRSEFRCDDLGESGCEDKDNPCPPRNS